MDETDAITPPPPPAIPLPEAIYSFVGGPAGTGKSWLAREWASYYEGIELCATTGIAALNLGGRTINSVLKYYDTSQLQDQHQRGQLARKIMKLHADGVRRLLLDEVSMLDARQLTCLVEAIDLVNADLEYVGTVEHEAELFGLTVVGDFCQLPPVKAPFAFEAPEWSRFADHTILLDRVWRQEDPTFVEALRRVRRGDRTVASQHPWGFHQQLDDTFEGSTILAKNDAVDSYNWKRLALLPSTPFDCHSSRWGDQEPEWAKHIPETLRLKPGALVMILANKAIYEHDEFAGYAYVNGDLATVLDQQGLAVLVELVRPPHTHVHVFPHVSEKSEHIDGDEAAELLADEQTAWTVKTEDEGEHYRKVVGQCTWTPLRLAWGTTVHKCVLADTRIRRRNELVEANDIRPGDFLHVGGVVEETGKSMERAFRLTTKRGYTIIASADHRWLTTTGWVSTREIGTALGRVTVGLNVGEVVAGLPSDAYAWWLGLTVGDGNYTHRREGQIHLGCTDKVLGDAWASEALNLGAHKASWRKDRRGLHLTCRSLRDRLEADGLGYVKGPKKRIPSSIWTRGVTAWVAFLRGLFDADGSVGHSYVVLATSSQRMGEEVQELLLACGVVSTRTRYMGRRDPYWQVRVDAEGLPAFKAMVGFSAQAKAEKLARTTPNRVQRPSGGFDVVVAVEDLGLSLPMIDIEVAAPHVIGTGAFRSHNSQGLSLDRAQINLLDPFFASPSMTYVALSRCRTRSGLRLVGGPLLMSRRMGTNPKCRSWL